MSAQVHSLPRSSGPAPLVPAGIDVRSADFMASDIKLLQKRSARMTAEHFGVWSRLHIASHLEEVTGTLPDDDVDLAIAAGFTAEGVDRWLAMKAKVLEDWLLCADGRWHHPSRARNVLHIWIGGRERDRRSALGNKSKSAKARATIAALEDAIEFGRDALARIDPQDRFLLGLDERISRWPSKADPAEASLTVVEEPCASPVSSGSYYDAGDPDYVRNTRLTATINETKRSEVKRKESIPFGQSPNGAREDAASVSAWEIEGGRDGPSHPDGDAPGERVVEAYPPGAFHRFWERWPNKVGLGAAERAFAKIQKSGQVGFATLMAALERYKRCKPVDRPWCNPATWLNQKRWLDEWPAEVGRALGGSVDRARTGPESGVAGISDVIRHLGRRAPIIEGDRP